MKKEGDFPATLDVTGRIHVLRGQRVILDSDLAALYGVTTGEFNQAVRRNADRFPQDFMFQLTNQEFATLRSQIVTSKGGRGGRQFAPYAFTGHGAIMAAGILAAIRALMDRPEGRSSPISGRG